ncbi:helix-turn-helix domain-containing protein [Clostridium isatidis]|uniref:helix-turn-helix domain-containing protein n=1 Tax=Clostridium isatidis TaxID=182773 RepID=UPI003AAC3260
MATFAERLKELRKEKQLTIEQLAKDLGSAKSTISRYENNKREPKKDFLEMLSNYFNVSVDYLLGKTDIRTPKVNEKPKKFSPEIETIAAHLDDKNITPKKLKMIQDYIDLLFDDEE